MLEYQYEEKIKKLERDKELMVEIIRTLLDIIKKLRE